MPCIILILFLMSPRLAIIGLYFLTSYFTGVFQSALMPLLGFIFLPLTLLAYTFLTKADRPMDGIYIGVMLIAVVLDLGLIGGGARSRRRR